MWGKANYFLDTILAEPPNHHHHSILMGLWDDVLAQEVPLKSYGKFWISPDNMDVPSTSYAKMYSLPPWAYQIVPLQAEKENSLIINTEHMVEKHGQPFGRLDSSAIVIDIFMEEADEDKENNVTKEHPVKHFYLDFRFMLLNRKIR